MNHLRPLALIGLLLSVFLLSAESGGCSRKKSALPFAKPATETRAVSYLLKKMKENEPRRAQSFSARADLHVEGGGQSISATANIIWIRDSAVWINVKKFGLEAIRALITPDSFYLLNRLEKTYMVRDLDHLLGQYGLPSGFPALQQTLLGNAWFFPDMPFRADIQDSLHRLNGTNGHYNADYRLDEGPFLLRREAFTYLLEKQQLSLEFDHFQPWPEGGFFPYFRKIEAFTPEEGWTRMEINLKDVQVNHSPTFRFEPGAYKKI